MSSYPETSSLEIERLISLTNAKEKVISYSQKAIIAMSKKNKQILDLSLPRTVQGVSPLDSKLVEMWGLLGPSNSGIYVDESSAVNVATVYSCISLISQTLAALPIGCFRKEPNDDRTPVDDHPSYWLFNKSPDEIMTAYNVRETAQGHCLLRGNSYFEIVRNYRGQAIELALLDPRKVSLEIKDELSEYGTYRKVPYYCYSQPIGPRIDFDRSEVLHFTSWSTNGISGVAPLTLFRESLGLTMAANRYAAEYFRKGGHPLGFLTKPGNISLKDRKTLQEEWLELHGGVENSHQIGVLSGGMDWKSIGLSNQDSQLLGLRQFQKYEIAEIFRVPPFLLGDVEQPVSNIEFMLIQFLIFTLLPIMKRHESEMNMKCFTYRERFNYYLEYNADAILRGDSRSRAESFQIMARNGALKVNEWRRKENMNSVPHGDVALVMASQMATLEDVVTGKTLQNKSDPADKKTTINKKEQQFGQLVEDYMSLNEHDRNRLKGLIVSLNGHSLTHN